MPSTSTPTQRQRRRGDYYPDTVSRHARRLLQLAALRRAALLLPQPGWRQTATESARRMQATVAEDLIAAGCAS